MTNSFKIANMEANWDDLTPAPYYDMVDGFYLIEGVHFGADGFQHFGEDAWNDPPTAPYYDMEEGVYVIGGEHYQVDG